MDHAVRKGMWKYAVLVVALVFCKETFAQNNVESRIAAEKADGWYSSTSPLAPEAFLESFKVQLGLDENYDFLLMEEKTDRLGFTHYRYRQMYRGVPVEGGELLLHARKNIVETANGELVKALEMNVSPSIDKDEAVAGAKEHIGAERYMWESESAELLQKTLGHNETNFAPDPELVIADPKYTKSPENYHLAWKMDIFAEKPMLRKYVFVDARSGDVLYTLDRIHHQNDTGTAVTRYHGVQTIVADSTGPGQYRLRESATGGGVETYNMERRTSFASAVDFTDDDNYWDNANADMDEAATDAHWGAERTYHYFMDNFGRDSYNDQGAKLVSFVHYDSNYVNAFWNGAWMTYGDGNGRTFSPLTALDVTGHEIAHGVTEFSAGLIYQGESGALNESFSDIFGTAIEFANDPANANWNIGEKFNLAGNGFRSMINPKAFGDPNTYGGENFGYGIFIDHGYVHQNSGVQNFWFYLLSEGASGVNDFGEVYTIDGIGIQKAEQIAYRNLAFYLTSTSNHEDARLGSIQAAEDIYGTCSDEVVQTTNAWYAVNVGDRIYENDLALLGFGFPEPACGLDSNESITITIGNKGCAQTIAAGDSVEVAYSINSLDTVTEIFTLTSPLPAGAIVNYTFHTTADLSRQGLHTIDAYIDYLNDTVAINDSIVGYELNNRPQQNSDIGISSILSPVPGCDLLSSFRVEAQVYFNGCDSLAVGETIDFAGDFSGTPISYTYTNPSRRAPGDTFAVQFPAAMSVSLRGYHTLNLYLENANDPNPGNDSILNYEVLSPFNIVGEKLSFENRAFADSLIITTSEESSAKRSIPARNNGLYGLMMTGGDALAYPEDITVPNETDVWITNEDFSAKACACVDASGYNDLTLQFDLRQRYSRIYQQLFNRDYPYASSLRILVNNVQVDSTIAPQTNFDDPYTTWFLNLGPYAGTSFELCFESRTLMNSGDNWVTGDGDETHLDNIIIGSPTAGKKEEHSQLSFAVYPNPSEGMMKLRLPSSWQGGFDVKMMDLGGKLLFAQSFDESRKGEEYRLETQLSAGVYLLQVEGADFSRTKKVVIH